VCIYLYNDDDIKKKFACLSRQLYRLQIKAATVSAALTSSEVSKFITQAYHLLFGCIWLSKQYKNAKSPAVVVFSKILLWHFRVIFFIYNNTKSFLLSFQTWIKKKESIKISVESQLIILCALCMSPILQWECIYSD